MRVLRNSGISEDISSAELVPGDIIELPSNKQAAIVCDAILLTGVCVVNESMLTGEFYKDLEQYSRMVEKKTFSYRRVDPNYKVGPPALGRFV